jgi:transposase
MGKCIAKGVSVSMGFDVDGRGIAVCAGTRERMVHEGRIAYELEAVDRFLERFVGCEVRVVYEAGPFGFALARHLRGRGVLCKVASPSLMPRAAGNRVKTDRRDARQLMELGWSEDLAEARVPTEEEEAERQIVRVRESLVRKRHRVMKQIKSFAYEHHRHELLGDWGVEHMEGLRGAEFSERYLRMSLDEYLREYEYLTGRVKALDGVLEELGRSARHREAVARMRVRKGIGVVTAVTVRAELFRPEEFLCAESVGCYLGLTPSERSSGGHRRLGHIHRMGNAHLRRVLVEAAWGMVRWEESAGRHFAGLRGRMGAKKAIVAVARRVGIGLWASMVRGEEFVYHWG